MKKQEAVRSFSANAEAILNFKAVRDSPRRALGLGFIKRFTAEEFFALGIGEKDGIKLFFTVACKEDFPSSGIYRRAVKHELVE